MSFTNLIDSRLPLLIGVVVALSLGLLLVVFRSVIIAVKAAVMNLLSVCAAYGVLTAVTQWGWLGHVFGFGEKMPVTTWVPVFLFVILFGLSMDYEVFLLSKIREEYDRCGDNRLAVGRGLAATARSSRPPRRSWWWCSCPSTSPRTSRSSRSVLAWPPRSSLTPPWSGWSWSRP